MWKRFVTVLVAGLTVLYAHAVDVNKGNAQDLTGVKGIGPAMSERIVAERKGGSFKNWDDFITRVKGVGPTVASKFSADGLTVNGQPYKSEHGAAAAKAGKPAPAKKMESAKKTAAVPDPARK